MQTSPVKHLNHKEFRRPILDILEDLKKPVHPRFIKHKVIKGQKIEYIPWHTLTRLLDYYAPGWSWKITTSFDSNRVCWQTCSGSMFIRQPGLNLMQK